MRIDLDPIPSADVWCHRTGFERRCRAMVVENGCRLWTAIQGADPSTGVQVTGYGCADQLVPHLIIENSQQQRQTGAAVESLRNIIVAARELSYGRSAAVEIGGGTSGPGAASGGADEG